MRLGVRLRFAVTAGLFAVSALACVDSRSLGNWPRDAGPPEGGADAGEACTDVKISQQWFGPYWVWTGPNNAHAPMCPPQSNGPPFDTYDDLEAQPVCEPCMCAPSTGKCALPSEITASTMGCYIKGGDLTSFNAPMGWDGKCDTTTHVDAGAATSVSIAPLTVTQESCAPAPLTAARSAVAPMWKKLARSCEGWDWTPHENADTFCIPNNQAPEGFRLCISREGPRDCPEDWPNKSRFYEGVDDQRACDDCTCGPPTGGMCTAMLSFDKDPTCTAPVKGLISISSAKAVCVGLSPPGQALVSKYATVPTYHPGTCEPSSNQAKGTATPTGVITYCCR